MVRRTQAAEDLRDRVELPLPDGSTVIVDDGAVEITDPKGRVLVRFRDGAAEIAAPAGDLVLSAPTGRVVIRAAREIALEAGTEGSARIGLDAAAARVEAPQVEIKAESARLTTTEATVLARRIATTATTLVQSVERFELTASRLIERTRDVFRDASELSQTRVGRARTIVKEAFTLHARRTALTSTEDTSIDGSKVLLG
jgi:hypothetical protein